MEGSAILVSFFVFLFLQECAGKIIDIHNEEQTSGSLSLAITDIAFGMRCKSLIVFRDIGEYNRVSKTLPNVYKSMRFLLCRRPDQTQLIKTLQGERIATTFFLNEADLSNAPKKQYFSYLSRAMDDSLDTASILFCTPLQCEDLLVEIREKNLVHRFLLYIFYWGGREPSNRFMATLHEAMRVAVITNPRTGVYRLYYNQVRVSRGARPLSLVNWWERGRLYRAPSLPAPLEVYSNLGGRVFRVPVLHAPPWHFVKLLNDSSIEVTGGRDHQLLKLLATKLNFKFQYFDPPQHSQGSGVSANGSFRGVLGMIYRREADFFLGDVTMSWERQLGVEFSFLTLADSGAFVTHARRKLSEALALLRPFRWQVWPAILITLAGSGPALWIAAAVPTLWGPQGPSPPSLSKCIWFTMSIFLKQCGRVPAQNCHARLVVLLLSFAATYVLSDVYSATLTSLLARPTLEPPLASLQALETAMLTHRYQLLVERHSSSLAKLQNGTGVYGRLWSLMKNQDSQTVRSVEQGVRRVLHHNGPPTVFLAGRETLYFNTRRYGPSNFQLSEKLYTRYSAVALQVGCPYIENFNKVLMQLFEAGILTKITYEEYEKLGLEIKADSVSNASSDEEGGDTTSPAGGYTPTPVSMRMLQAAFYILVFGYVLSGILLIYEVKANEKAKQRRTGCKGITSWLKSAISYLRLQWWYWTNIGWRTIPHRTLEYIE